MSLAPSPTLGEALSPAAALPRNWSAVDAPIVEEHAVETCAVCGAERKFDAFAHGYDYELETCRNRWRFVRCRDCGHAWLNPRPAVAALPTIYPPHYYAYRYDDCVNPVAAKAKAWLDRRKLAAVVKRLGRWPSSFLDIGCGEGRFLRVMHEGGTPAERCVGLELDADVVDRLQSQGFDARHQRIEDAKLPAESVKLATMFHVIEHVADPGAVIDRVAAALTPGGMFALETPNLDAFDARLGQDRFWGGYHIPRHWHLFTAETMRRLLERHGLRVDAVRYQTGHSFWVYSLRHRLIYGKPGWAALGRKCDPFANLPLTAGATAFDTFRAKLGAKTSAMLVLARKPG